MRHLRKGMSRESTVLKGVLKVAGIRWLDTHIHVSNLGKNGKPREHFFEDLVDVLHRCDADLRLVISPDTPWNQIVMQEEDGMRRACESIHDLVQQAPNRFYGSCLVNPYFLDMSLKTMDICFEKWGFVQLGEMLQYMMDYELNSDAVEKLTRRAVEYDVPVHVHISTSNRIVNGLPSGTGHLLDLMGLVERVPEAKYILAHVVGCPDDDPPIVDEYLELIEREYGDWPDNFWMEIRDFNSPGVKSILSRVPFNRIICGTDWTTRIGPPFMPYGMIFQVESPELNPYPPSVASMSQLLLDAGGTEEAVSAIGFDNAAALLRIQE